MSTLEIIKYPNPLLKKKSKAVKRVDDRTKKLITDMTETMHEAPGVGLAAPQVGELLRIIVVDIGEGPLAIVNPKLKKRSGEQIFVEGCLSLPNLEAPVKRASKILVSGMDRNGKAFLLEAEALLATVIQHEMDHLDGKLFIDRADPGQIKHLSREETSKRDSTCSLEKSEECMM